MPDCKIKKNILIYTPEGNAEIDCLLLYNNKLFAIEIKRWKGEIYEQNGDFVQYKEDKWTDEIHTKTHKSPFKQLRRAIFLLKKQIPENVWINPIVYFEESNYIKTNPDEIWFSNIESLVSYIVNDGNQSRKYNPDLFFEKCIASDYLFGSSWGNSLHCLICNNSLNFNTPAGFFNQSQIHSISIIHHWSYDELHIQTIDGLSLIAKLENESIDVIDNGYRKKYPLSKLDYIEFGKQ